MDATSITDIQYAIIALEELRCGPVRYLSGIPIPKRTYWSKLDAIQRELHCLVQLLEILSSDDGYLMVSYPKWAELAVSRCVAGRAKSSVAALDNAINHLRKDVSRGPSGMSPNTRSILEGARIWNDSLIDMLDDVTPRDRNSTSLDHSNLPKFYDTMWDLQSELAELGTDLVVTSGGMTLGSSAILKHAATNPPAKPPPYNAPRGKFRQSRPYPAQNASAEHSRTIPVNSQPREQVPAGTPDTSDDESKPSQAADEARPPVSPHTHPKGQGGIHHAKNSLDLKFEFPPRPNPRTREPKSVRSRVPVATSRPVDRSPPRYTRAPRPHQVPLAEVKEDIEYLRDHPEFRFSGFDSTTQRDAIAAGLAYINKQINKEPRVRSPSVPRQAKEHSPHVEPPNAAKAHKLSRNHDISDRHLDDDEDDFESVFTITTSMGQQIDAFRAHKRAKAAAAAATPTSRAELTPSRSPQPSSSASNPSERHVTPPPPNSRKHRRTLPELVIETHRKLARAPKYEHLPTVGDTVKTGEGKGKGKGKEPHKGPVTKDEKKTMPSTTTLEALKAIEKGKDDKKNDSKRNEEMRATVQEWNDGGLK